jgi:DNA ligase-1
MKNFMLAQYYDWSFDPKGWFMSEKLNGHRAVFNKHFIKRGNTIVTPPSWFMKDFPDVTLDGEIYAGRGNLRLVQSLGPRELDWKNIVFAVFDAPEYQGPFKTRYSYISNLLKNRQYILTVPHVICEGKDDLQERLDAVIDIKGEGLMLRHPDSLYEHKRSNKLLKVKKWYYDTAVIIGHLEKNRPGMIGSFLCRDDNGYEFKVTGLNDALASNPYPIGTRLEYRYYEKNKGKPKPATLFRVIN